MYTVRLNSLKYYSNHGLYPQEGLLNNEFEVNLEVSSDTDINAKNDIQQLIDYTILKDVVDQYMNQQFLLLEDVLGNIVQQISKRYPFSKGEVSIKKMNPPFGGRCDSSEVILKF